MYPSKNKDITYLLTYLGLRKVTDAEKTHKNPALRSAPGVTPTAPKASTTPQLKKFSAPVANKPPVFELQNKKWVVVSSYLFLVPCITEGRM